MRAMFSRLPVVVKVRLRNLFRPHATQYVLTSADHVVMQILARAKIRAREDSIWPNHGEPIDWTPEPFIRHLAEYWLDPEGIPNVLQYDLVSVDFWDTMFARCRPAEGVKKASSLRTSFLIWSHSGFRQKRIHAEQIHNVRLRIEGKISSRFQEVQLKDVMDEFGRLYCLSASELEWLHQAEIEDEIRHSSPIKAVCEFLDFHTLWVVSDFYIGSEGVARIMQGHGFNVERTRILVSSDHGKTKRSNGDLFRLLPNFGLQKWVHVGDNPSADGARVVGLGGTALQVTKVVANSWNSHEAPLEKLAGDLADHLGQNEAGSMLVHGASLAYGLITWAIEIASLEGLEHIVYLSREGATLHKAHQIISQYVSDSGGPSVTSMHLPVSRASVFGPSNADNLGDAMATLALQYPRMTGAALAATLGLPGRIANKVKNQLGSMREIPTDDIIHRLDSDLSADINEYLSHQRELITVLLHERGINPESSLLCDLGWRGTIQDSLGKILGREFSGAYLGLRMPLEERRLTSKRGFLFDELNGKEPPDFLNFVGHLERFFTTEDSQVVAFRNTTEGVDVVKSQTVDGPSTSRRALMESNWSRAVEEVAKCWLSVGVFGAETAPMARQILMDWTLNPNSLQASCWFDETHDDSFGVGKQCNQAPPKPNQAWLGPGRVREISRSVQLALWPTGYLNWSPVRSFMNEGVAFDVEK